MHTSQPDFHNDFEILSRKFNDHRRSLPNGKLFQSKSFFFSETKKCLLQNCGSVFFLSEYNELKFHSHYLIANRRELFRFVMELYDDREDLSTKLWTLRYTRNSNFTRENDKV